MEAAYVAH